MEKIMPKIIRPVTVSEANSQEAADYYRLCFLAVSGIDDAISILNARKFASSTPANELRLIDFELGDQIAKKARIFALMNAFSANQRAMKPPTAEMLASAAKLTKVLDEMIAANVIASQVVVTSTQLFKIWRETEG
jgi:hypothetical protein